MSTPAPHLTLYYFSSCPFCVRVRLALRHLGLDIAMKNIHRDPGAREELLAGGGRGMVPCLRTDRPDGTSTWMYESRDIVRHLRDQYTT